MFRIKTPIIFVFWLLLWASGFFAFFYKELITDKITFETLNFTHTPLSYWGKSFSPVLFFTNTLLSKTSLVTRQIIAKIILLISFIAISVATNGFLWNLRTVPFGASYPMLLYGFSIFLLPLNFIGIEEALSLFLFIIGLFLTSKFLHEQNPAYLHYAGFLWTLCMVTSYYWLLLLPIFIGINYILGWLRKGLIFLAQGALYAFSLVFLALLALGELQNFWNFSLLYFLTSLDAVFHSTKNFWSLTSPAPFFLVGYFVLGIVAFSKVRKRTQSYKIELRNFEQLLLLSGALILFAYLLTLSGTYLIALWWLLGMYIILWLRELPSLSLGLIMLLIGSFWYVQNFMLPEELAKKTRLYPVPSTKSQPVALLGTKLMLFTHQHSRSALPTLHYPLLKWHLARKRQRLEAYLFRYWHEHQFPERIYIDWGEPDVVSHLPLLELSYRVIYRDGKITIYEKEKPLYLP